MRNKNKKIFTSLIINYSVCVFILTVLFIAIAGVLSWRLEKVIGSVEEISSANLTIFYNMLIKAGILLY